jgi:phosphomannomutase/phosphoglucomutase
MSVNPSIFREYDIRGHAAQDFNEDSLRQLTHAVITYFEGHGRKKMLVGHDSRQSSPRILATVLQVATERGMPVANIGQVTTPAFYFASRKLGIDAGFIITASHNPPPDNGMKVLLGPATIHGEEIQKIRALAESTGLQEVAAAAQLQPTAVQHAEIDIKGHYIETLMQKIELGPRKLRVVVDCGNGTAGPITESFLKSRGIDYIPLFFDPDPSFPNHEPDPTKSKNLVHLREKVLEIDADFGVGFDGDGDRIGVVDDKGNIVWGDKLMALFWREILPKHPHTPCLVEVKCSQALVDEIVRLGGTPEFCKTGHSLIKALMREKGAVFTGEMSGHIFFADEYYGFDDALYAFGRLLRILSHSDKPLSEHLSTLNTYYGTSETRIPCPDDIKFDVVDKLTRALSSDYETITIDGVRVLFPEGWGLFRCSNTQPVIVARCEAKTPEKREEYTAVLDRALAQVCPELKIPWEYTT